MCMKKLSAVLLSLFLFFAIAHAQSAVSPIKWRMSVKMTSATEGTVTLTAIIEDGWHLYGSEIPENGPIPTSFDFSQSKGVEFESDFTPSVEPITTYDSTFGLTTNQWEGKVSFLRNLTLINDIEDAVISGLVRYMACNGENCLPPSTQTFNTSPKPYAAPK